MGRLMEIDQQGQGATSGIPDTARPGRDLEGLGLDVLAAWVSASPDAVVVLDGDLRIVYVNSAACALFGYPVERLLGQSALMLTAERHRQTAFKYWSDVLEGRSEALLAIAFRADGSELEIEVSGTVLNRGGKPFLVFLARDVTE
jgi:PAS domain S-box-containing protein